MNPFPQTMGTTRVAVPAFTITERQTMVLPHTRGRGYPPILLAHASVLRERLINSRLYEDLCF